jgi:AmmeMemoRadiSam system protein A
VEIPFLQKAFTDFKIVPVIMGQPSFALLEKFAATLKEIISDRSDVLIVVSTDLSHYHDDATARVMDDVTISTVKELDAKKLWDGCRSRSSMEMCGYVPVTAAILYAQKQGLKHAQVLRYANSGDIIGDRDRVVGYASIVICRDVPAGPPLRDAAAKARAVPGVSLGIDQKKRLLQIAKETIYAYVSTGKVAEVKETDPRLMKDEGAFVTIHKAGRLRGCIGNIIGRQALYLTVRDVAISSATDDPRFPRVTKEELGQIEVEISVLSKPRVITDVGEIVLGQHGVIVSQGPFHQGVFLPQVATETGWGREEFLSQLCAQKAGLAPDAWKNPKTKIEIFSAEVFSEKDL